MALLGMLTSANVRAATGTDLPTVNFANLAGSFGIAVLEGGTRTTNLAILTISLSAPSDKDITVFWKTSDSTATAASGDYQAVSSGNLKFPAGTTTQTITNFVYGVLILPESLPADRRSTLVATPDEHGFRFDVRLQGDDETVFLQFPGA